MGIFDFLKPSYNFANHIKILFKKLDIPIEKDNKVNGYNLLVLHDTLADILGGRQRIPSGMNIKILYDIKEYLATLYIKNFDNIKQMEVKEQRKYLINIFDKQELTILKFTLNVMYYSAMSKGLFDYYNYKDTEIVKKVFGF